MKTIVMIYCGVLVLWFYFKAEKCYGDWGKLYTLISHLWLILEIAVLVWG
mgnify:CR=1 FL=1